MEAIDRFVYLRLELDRLEGTRSPLIQTDTDLNENKCKSPEGRDYQKKGLTAVNTSAIVAGDSGLNFSVKMMPSSLTFANRIARQPL